MSTTYSGRHRNSSSAPRTTSGLALAGVAAAAAMTLTAPAAQAAPGTATVVAPQAFVVTTTWTGTVRYGDRGSKVKAVQEKLGITADGIFGRQTLRSVKAFQSKKGLHADGIVGPKTAAALGLTSSAPTNPAPSNPAPSNPAPTNPAPTTPSPAGSFTGTVRYGDRGTIVKKIQAKLSISADGVFGRGTLRSVKSFQSAHGLSADGVVGPKTGTAMGLTDRDSDDGTSRGGSGSKNDAIIATAKSLLGIPYHYGGTSPSTGFDCSGFTQYVYGKNGIDLPRTAAQQQRALKRISNPIPGDLVFFGYPAHHVGIYAGNGKLYDSGRAGLDTMLRDIWSSNVTYGRA